MRHAGPPEKTAIPALWAWWDFILGWPTLTPAEADRRCICPLEWLEVED